MKEILQIDPMEDSSRVIMFIDGSIVKFTEPAKADFVKHDNKFPVPDQITREERVRRTMENNDGVLDTIVNDDIIHSFDLEDFIQSGKRSQKMECVGLERGFYRLNVYYNVMMIDKG